MKKPLYLIFIFISFQAISQKADNLFFPLHNIIRGDSIYNTYDKQVEFIKNTGFGGIEINQIDAFEGMKAALDKHHFAGAYFYVKVKLEPPYWDERLRKYIAQLKGSKTIIAPYIIRETNPKIAGHTADTTVVRLMRQLAKWAKEAGLQVALYPHVGFYVETVAHALALTKQIDCKNLGLSFNLCHWLATTDKEERMELKSTLKDCRPYLKMVTICGANEVFTEKENIWDDYILPLGMGSFDTYALLEYLIGGLKFKGPVGVQCYHLKGSKPQLVKNTFAVWQNYKTRLMNQSK